VASRMESQGVPGRIHVSEAFKNAASDAFEYEPRGDSDLRGIGSVPTFFLLRERPRR
jgi:adenylate cyclase